MVYNLSENYSIITVSSRLPQHISLKQSFKVKDISDVEHYFDEFAKKIKPFRIELQRVELRMMKNDIHTNQILWFEVKESQDLRNLHDRLNLELAELYGIEKQGFDGDSWKFHSTIAYGFNQEEIFQKYYESIKHMGERLFFNVEKIAMFYSPDEELIADNFITYKILSLNRE